MTLATQIAADVPTVFLNIDDFATTITYRQGGFGVSLTALVDSSVFETANTFGLMRHESRDFIIQASTLLIGGSVRTPQRGDWIDEGDNRYIVTSPTGEPEWRYEDENRYLLRIHTTLQKVL